MCSLLVRLECDAQVISTTQGSCCVVVVCVVITNLADKLIPNTQSRLFSWDCPEIGSVSTAPPSTNYAALEERKVRKCPNLKLTDSEFLQLLKERCSGLASPPATPLDTDIDCGVPPMVISRPEPICPVAQQQPDEQAGVAALSTTTSTAVTPQHTVHQASC